MKTIAMVSYYIRKKHILKLVVGQYFACEALVTNVI